MQHLTLDEVLGIHRRLIEVFGGPDGARPRPPRERTVPPAYRLHLVEMAAALFESLLMNHCFVDGNKRVAFFATDVFLRLNGWEFTVEPEPAHDHLIGLLERGEADFEHLGAWILQSIARL